MFGYIKPLEGELRVRELDSYKAVYCGLCRALSHTFGPFARFALSYDFTFAAMLYASLQPQPPAVAPQRCPYQPLRKRPHLERCASTDFCCDILMLLLEGKLLDNISDSGAISKIGWRLAHPVTAIPAKQAAKRRPEAAEIVRRFTERQQETERLERCSLDEACDPTAQALGDLFSLMSAEPAAQRILNRLGYMLGRYVYLCDAIDDLEEDERRRRFNPLSGCYDPQQMMETVRATAAEGYAAWLLLTPSCFGSILDNILRLGLIANAELLIERRDRHE